MSLVHSTVAGQNVWVFFLGGVGGWQLGRTKFRGSGGGKSMKIFEIPIFEFAVNASDFKNYSSYQESITRSVYLTHECVLGL